MTSSLTIRGIVSSRPAFPAATKEIETAGLKPAPERSFSHMNDITTKPQTTREMTAVTSPMPATFARRDPACRQSTQTGVRERPAQPLSILK